jgi:AcrR family transcriptional regulator
MPRLIDTGTRTGTMVEATMRILATRGAPGLTLRGIARESRISTGSLLHHFESRERILGVAAHRTGRAHLDEIESGILWHGVQGFLPGDEETRLLTLAWLGWCELWRTEETLVEIVAEVRRQEMTMLAEQHEHRLSRPDLDVLVAVIDGLRLAVCAPIGAMSFTRARDLLAATSAAASERSA